MTRLTTCVDAEAVGERAAADIARYVKGTREQRGVAHLALSGSRVRELLKSGQRLPEEFTRPEITEILSEATEPEPARSAVG